DDVCSDRIEPAARNHLFARAARLTVFLRHRSVRPLRQFSENAIQLFIEDFADEFRRAADQHGAARRHALCDHRPVARLPLAEARAIAGRARSEEANARTNDESPGFCAGTEAGAGWMTERYGRAVCGR